MAQYRECPNCGAINEVPQTPQEYFREHIGSNVLKGISIPIAEVAGKKYFKTQRGLVGVAIATIYLAAGIVEYALNKKGADCGNCGYHFEH